MAEQVGQHATETGTRCLAWVKSSASNSQGGTENCVEVAATSHRVLVRDSKDPGVHLPLDPTTWRAFLACHCQ